MKPPETGIPREPELPAALDYERLRREGLDHIQTFGSALWTDYNPSDSGVALLEALCFAITDLGYRCSFSMPDLLAPRPGQPRPDVAPLFSARTLLTCNPVTVLDWRRVLIDVKGVRNAWLRPATRPCEPFRVDDQLGKLVLAEDGDPVAVQGVWDVVLELEDDPLLGSLGDTTWPWRPVPPGQEALPLEVLFPTWDECRRPAEDSPLRAVAWGDPWLAEDGALELYPSGAQVVEDGAALQLRVKVVVSADGSHVERTVPVRVRLRTMRRGTLADWQGLLVKALARPGPDNPVCAWRHRLRAAFVVVKAAWQRLHAHRNLCEDFNAPRAAVFEEVALCAEVDVEPDADLEAVQARILVTAARRLAPPVRFHTLAELLARGMAVEDVLEGPELEHGFLLDEELRASDVSPGQRFEVHASRLLADLQAVEGVRTVRSLAMAAYAPDGRVLVPGEAWRIVLEQEHLPRLAPDRCRLTFFKNGVAFTPHRDEAERKRLFLAEKEGLHRVVRPRGLPLDVVPPTGTWRGLDDYRLVRDSLPHALGASPESLPTTAGVRRKAQARQLQGFLLFFDQLLAGYVEQLAHLRELFSVDPKVERTLFSAPLHLRPELKDHYHDGYAATQGVRDALAEDEPMYTARHNHVLDHLLARFNERFSEYAAIMATLAPQGAEDAGRIEEKRAFLRDYPRMSGERGRGVAPPHVATHDERRFSEAVSGLERRLCGLLLGVERCERRALASVFGPPELYDEQDGAGDDGHHEYRFRLRDPERGDAVLLSSSTRYATVEAALAELDVVEAYAAVRERYVFAQDERGKFYFNLTDPTGAVIARRIEYFNTRDDADKALARLVSLVRPAREQEGMHLVEHVLLRPRSATDGLMAVAVAPGCEPCAEEADPYSFRATVVVPAWAGRFTQPAFRAFFEQTARLEAPAHVGLKVCWLDRAQMRDFEAAYLPWLKGRVLLEPDAHDPAITTRLVEVLQSLRSVHPLATLHLPVEEGDPAPTRLGANRLGGRMNPTHHGAPKE